MIKNVTYKDIEEDNAYFPQALSSRKRVLLLTEFQFYYTHVKQQNLYEHGNSGYATLNVKIVFLGFYSANPKQIREPHLKLDKFSCGVFSNHNQ